MAGAALGKEIPHAKTKVRAHVRSPSTLLLKGTSVSSNSPELQGKGGRYLSQKAEYALRYRWINRPQTTAWRQEVTTVGMGFKGRY